MSSYTNTLLAAASVAAMTMAAPVLAADSKSPAMERQAQSEFGMNATTAIKADTLVGKDVKNIAGEDIGEIQSVIIDGTGKVSAVVVSVGGFLGMGEREVAIDWNDLRLFRNGEVIQSRMTKNDLKALPEYEYEKDEYRRKAFEDRRYAETVADRSAKPEWVATKRFRLSRLVGADVVNSQGETIGEVDDLVVMDGKSQLILSVGEFLGMGGHDVALAAIHRQRDDAEDLRVSVSMSKEQLKALPKYDARQ